MTASRPVSNCSNRSPRAVLIFLRQINGATGTCPSKGRKRTLARDLRHFLSAGRGGFAGEAVDETGDALGGDFDLLEGGGVAATDEAFAAGAEGAAGDDGDFFLFQEAEGEIARAKPGGAD